MRIRLTGLGTVRLAVLICGEEEYYISGDEMNFAAQNSRLGITVESGLGNPLRIDEKSGI